MADHCDVITRVRAIDPISLPPSLPIYVCSQYEVGPEFADSPRVIAMTSAILDCHLRPWLEEAGKWQGPGIAIIVYNLGVLYGDVDDGTAIILHEIAHALDAEVSSESRRVANLDPDIGRQIAIDHGPPKSAVDKFPGVTFPRGVSHEAQFLRAGLHLQYRAWQRGWMITPNAMYLGGEQYGLSSGTEYRNRLIDELKREAETPIPEILRKPAPEGFEALWRDDTQKLILVRGSPSV